MLIALIEEAMSASFKDSLEIDIAFFGQQRKMHFDRLLAHYLELEEANDFDSLNSLLQSFAVNFHGKARYLKHLVSAGKMSNAADYITAWHGIDYQNDELTSERENFTDFVTDHIANFYEDNIPSWPTSEAYFSSLESLVENNLYGVSCKANNILHFNNMTTHRPKIDGSERNSRTSLFSELRLLSGNEKINLPNGKIKIYPNPSSGNFTLDYSTENDVSNLQYEIVTLKGAFLQKGRLQKGINELHIVQKGTFILSIVENDVSIASYKIHIR